MMRIDDDFILLALPGFLGLEVFGRRGLSGNLAVDGVFLLVLTSPLLEFKFALQRSVSQRQAVIPAPGVSEISTGEQLLAGFSGDETGPSKMEVEKHSLKSKICKRCFKGYCVSVPHSPDFRRFGVRFLPRVP